MKSTDLFSHRYEPKVASHTGRDSEPVQLPTFSDRTQERFRGDDDTLVNGPTETRPQRSTPQATGAADETRSRR